MLSKCRKSGLHSLVAFLSTRDPSGVNCGCEFNGVACSTKLAIVALVLQYFLGRRNPSSQRETQRTLTSTVDVWNLAVVSGGETTGSKRCFHDGQHTMHRRQNPRFSQGRRKHRMFQTLMGMCFYGY
ncbi:hypothetical protein R1flu_003561 [Riccia fluitans]|uniref:Uncharacterized protein n=1 Tax=Riccia fluitans TaxID=41844 RepID=A0ABD1Y9Q4_9MARC